MNRRNHPFASYNFPELFDYDMDRISNQDSSYFTLQIHPDDRHSLTLNGIKSFRHTLEAAGAKTKHKLISEYRINLGGKYVRAIEQMQVLECDRDGNIWLSLCTLDISPNQSPFVRVEAKIFDMETRSVIPMPEYPEYKAFETSAARELTARERDVLKLVREGLLSKGISGQLNLSVNTANTYRQRIIEKLNVNNSKEAIRYAEKLGLLE